MHETSKSIQRRLHDSGFATRYFVGDGIDIGAGPDSLGNYAELFPLVSSVRVWDRPDGDAQEMAGCSDEAYDFVHSSHCLEHMRDPQAALASWFRILRPGGHLIVLVPDEDMYEQGVFPSTFNRDHKWTFTIYKESSWSSRSRNLIDMLKQLGGAADVIRMEQLVGTYRFGLNRVDQTVTPIGESAIEIVIRKRSGAELRAGGSIGSVRADRTRRADKLPPQQVYRNLGRVRDAVISADEGTPHSLVIPHATYSPWRQDPEFLSAYEAIRRHTRVDLYRCYELWGLVRQTAHISGAILQVGVSGGGTGCLLGLAMRSASIEATLFLADAVAGFGSATERADPSVRALTDLLVANRVAHFRILRGSFPEEAAHELGDERLRMCHIDVEAHQSARKALELVWPRLSPGGIVVFEGYGFKGSEGLTNMVNEQRSRPNILLLHNLNGHAILIKQQ